MQTLRNIPRTQEISTKTELDTWQDSIMESEYDERGNKPVAYVFKFGFFGSYASCFSSFYSASSSV